MDINETLSQVLAVKDIILKTWEEWDGDVMPTSTELRAVELAELVDSLNNFINKDGFLPDAWRK